MGTRAASVLATLALAHGRHVSRDHLLESCWGDEPRSPNALQAQVSRLRKLLSSAFGPPGDTWNLVSNSDGYTLRLPVGSIDIERFEELVDQADVALMRGDYALCEQTASAAVALHEGRPLSGVASHPLETIEAAKLVDRLLVAHELWADAALSLGHDLAVVDQLAAVVVNNQFAEKLWRRLILALYRLGRQADALTHFDRLRHLLRDELGLDPSPDLVALQQAILRQDPTLLPTPPVDGPADAKTASAKARRASLPWFTNPIVGREEELAYLEADLLRDDVRVLTVMGPGGAGKTRLAVEAARRLGTRLPGGVVFVDASPAKDPDGLTALCLRAIGEESQTARDISAALSGASCLLLVDNAEHLAATIDRFLVELIQAAPNLTVLLTSRVAVNTDFETRFVLQALEPEDAVQIFTDRARRVNRGFRTDERTEASVKAICQRLDNLPLAIELAAARVRLLTIDDLAKHVTENALALNRTKPSARGDLTLLDTIRWSVELLTPAAASALERLSLLRGSFTLRLAESVLDLDALPTLEVLSELIDSSLMVGPPAEQVTASGEPARFTILQTVRDFARRTLSPAEMEIVARQVADYFTTTFMPGPDGKVPATGEIPVCAGVVTTEATRAALAEDLPNFVYAVDWLTDTEPERAADLLLWTFRGLYLTGQLRLASRLVERLRSLDDLAPQTRARLDGFAGTVLYYTDDNHAAAALLTKASQALRELTDSSYAALLAAMYLVAALTDTGRDAEALAAADLLLADAESVGDPIWLALALEGAQYAARGARDFERAVDLSARSVAVAHAHGDDSLEINARASLAGSLVAAGRAAEALDDMERVMKRLGAAPRSADIHAGVVHCAYGRVLYAVGRTDEAAIQLATTVLNDAEIDVRPENLSWAALAFYSIEPAIAAQFLGAADTIDDSDGPPPHIERGTLDALRTEHPAEVASGRAQAWPGVAHHATQSLRSSRKEELRTLRSRISAKPLPVSKSTKTCLATSEPPEGADTGRGNDRISGHEERDADSIATSDWPVAAPSMLLDMATAPPTKRPVYRRHTTVFTTHPFCDARSATKKINCFVA